MARKKICGLNRREFFALSGATAAAVGMAHGGGDGIGPVIGEPPCRFKFPERRRAKVCVVFAHRPSGNATWPTKNYDYDARRKKLTKKLQAGCPGTDFVVQVAHSREEAQKILETHKDVDGFAVYMIGIWTGVADTIMQSGVPTIVIDDLYAGSGEMLGPGPKIRKDNLRAALISSSDFDDVIRGIGWLETIAAMKGAKIINVKDRDIRGQIENVKNVFGTEMVQMKSDELVKRYEGACEEMAAKWADYWAAGADRVLEPKREDLLKSGKIHAAFCKAIEDYEADAITMDCLGMFYGNKIDAYPCLSFFEMLNQGLTGVCESDVDSTTTFLLVRFLSGRPGFISDPVIDTSTNEIIYAHSVGTNRVFGAEAKPNPYVIRSHAEDEQGAAIQSLMPLNETVTTARVALGDKRLMVHTGRTTRNVFETKACRTKLAAEADTEMLLRNWTRGWHRVTFYGDYRKDLVNLAQLLGLGAIEEDRHWAQV